MPHICTKIVPATQSGWLRAGLALAGGAAVVFYCNRAMANAAYAMRQPPMSPAREVVGKYLSGDRDGLSQLQALLADTDAKVQGCLSDREAIQIPLSKLRADPFKGAFAADSPIAVAADLRKSDDERIAMLQDVEKLQLQSVVSSGDRPVCMIDNRFYREGEQIGNFTIERIGGSEVVVRERDYRFELKVGG
jgi:hypothetical protein